MGSFLFLWDKEFLNQKQIDNIRRHKYKAEGSSLVEPVFQKFWVSLIDHVPSWMAPNILTLLGLTANFIAFLPLAILCPTFKEEPPAWALILFTCCFFIYQTLDALDGKQARKIGMSSPMGELFDHGCDAVNTVIVSIVYNISLRLGLHPAVNMFSFCNTCFTFYLAHWLTYCTGVLHFGYIDITEAQLSIMIHLVFTSFAGSTFWDQEVMVVGQMRILFIVVVSALCLPAILTRLHHILIQGGSGRAGSTVADSSVLSPVKSIFCAFVFMWLIQHKSQQPNVAEEYTLLFYSLFGLYFSKITTILIVAHMCRSELWFWDLTMWGPGIVCLNQYLNYVFPEHYVLMAAVVWCTVDYFVYVIRVLLQLSSALELPVLTVPRHILAKQAKTSKTSSSNESSQNSTRSSSNGTASRRPNQTSNTARTTASRQKVRKNQNDA
ncbi:cholinephosphotransferase 1-like [Symsagittifera roscoffensis]|uniref:cholinephosphotransferase 1-like n=1 Tax=Symsagittifera roscoffensis TaxID=84072 RepID=UPI00307B98BB